MIISMTWFKTWIDPGLGPVLSRRGSTTWLATNLGSAWNWGTAMKWAIIFPSLLRSSRSYLLHIRVDSRLQDESARVSSISIISTLSSSASHTGNSSFSLSPTTLLSEVFVQSGWESISLDFVPKLRPNRFVVGVPVTIHLLSTLSSLAKGTKVVDKVADTWPSSMTRRFHLICRKGDTSFVRQRQMGTRLAGNSVQEQGFQECNLDTSWELASAVNSAKESEYVQIFEVLAYSYNSLI